MVYLYIDVLDSKLIMKIIVKINDYVVFKIYEWYIYFKIVCNKVVFFFFVESEWYFLKSDVDNISDYFVLIVKLLKFIMVEF